MICSSALFFFFFFNDTATTEIYTLSLHDALPILDALNAMQYDAATPGNHEFDFGPAVLEIGRAPSELQSPCNLVCRLLLEKKKKLRDTHRICNTGHL